LGRLSSTVAALASAGEAVGVRTAASTALAAITVARAADPSRPSWAAKDGSRERWLTGEAGGGGGQGGGSRHQGRRGGGGGHLRNEKYLTRGHLACRGGVMFRRFLPGARPLSRLFCGRFTARLWLVGTCVVQELVLGGPKAHWQVHCLRHPSRLVLPRQKAAKDKAAG
jgi:hypothetical protein